MFPRTNPTARAANTSAIGIQASIRGREFMATMTVRHRITLFAHRLQRWSNTKASSQVLAQRDGFQMGRVDATADPAQMVQLHPVRDWSGEQFVGYAVGLCAALIGVPHKAVSTYIHGGGPQPATGVRLWGDLLKKALHQRRSSKLILSHCDSPGIAVVRAARRVNAVAARSYFSAEVSA